MIGIGAVLWNWTKAAALWVFGIFCRILHIERTKKADEAFLQFVKFGIVGVSNTVVHYGIYAASLMSIQSAGLFEKWDYIIATAAAFFISVLWSFFWNNKFVFTMEEGERRSLFPALIKTYVLEHDKKYGIDCSSIGSSSVFTWAFIYEICRRGKK